MAAPADQFGSRCQAFRPRKSTAAAKVDQAHRKGVTTSSACLNLCVDVEMVSSRKSVVVMSRIAARE